MEHTAATTSRTAIRPAFGLLLAALVLVACDATNPVTSVAPAPASTLGRVGLTPDTADLFTLPPANTVGLTLTAWNEAGTRMSTAGGVVTYSSSAPTIAAVNGNGVVTGLAPGTAVITAAITLGGVSSAATTTVSVLEHAPVPQVGGVYDLTALITGSDPVWGIEDGTTQVAVISIQQTDGGPQITGTFAEFRAIAPDGEEFPGQPGSVSGVVYPDGRIVLELTFTGSQSSYWYGEGIATTHSITGRFGAGGHISGSFTAGRR